MKKMLGRCRVRASWLILVLFTSMGLGVCAGVLSTADEKLPCCANVGDDHSFTSCCGTGEQSSTSELPVAVQALSPSAIARAVTPQASPGRLLPHRSVFSAIPQSADPQAFLSTFLI